MFGHVRCQNLEDGPLNKSQGCLLHRHVKLISMSYHVYDYFAQGLSLFFAEVLEDIAVVFLQKLKANSQVVILQHRRVIVHQGQF